jgi:hypothetical protein
MDQNIVEAVVVRVVVAYLYVQAIASLKNPYGLPCFIYYSSVFQLLNKVWCGCYQAAYAFGYSELECDFLFRWFILGGVLDSDEIQGNLAMALKYCTFVPIPESAWGTLQEMFKFATQHGKLDQPWGLDCINWIQRHRLNS